VSELYPLIFPVVKDILSADDREEGRKTLTRKMKLVLLTRMASIEEAVIQS
jgi:hypothetical protein